MFKTSCLYEANYFATEDVLVNQGGSSSGKTYSILQVLFTKAIQSPIVITVVGESIPNLKAGALRDALDIYNNSETLRSKIADYNRTDRIFQFVNGSVMEFKSYETSQNAKSGKRDYLFVNEAQGITYDIFNELYMRTRKQVYIDYNPNAEFWVHENLIGTEGVKLFISDHRHNPFVAQKIRDKIEGLRFKDMELFKVYARGMTGKIEGLVFRNFDIVNEIPLGAELLGIGMDFGFTNDPTTVIKVFRYNSEIYIDELLYRTGLTNSDIANELTRLGVTRAMPIVADSAEPKSIEDLTRAGFRVEGANKGADSIRNSIDTLKQFKINITRTSTYTIKEFRSYKWIDGTNSPIDFNNHCFTGDTMITTLKGQKRIDEIKIGDKVLTSKGYKKVLKTFNNGVRQVNKYSMQLGIFNVSLCSTKEHKIKTIYEWKQISQLQSGQMVYLHKSSITKNTTYTLEKDISQKETKECTQKFGSTQMVQYLKPITYIIKILTLGIITLITWNWLKSINIYHNTVNKGLLKIKNGLKNFTLRVLLQLKNGISQLMVKNGTVNTELKVGLTENTQLKYANNVKKNIKQDTQDYQSTAIKTVKLKRLEQGGSYNALVYDLMVEDCHEYIANGILVHNCIDAIRYVALNKINKGSGRYSFA